MVSAMRMNIGRKTTAMMLIMGSHEPGLAVPARMSRTKLRERDRKSTISAAIWDFTHVQRQQPPPPLLEEAVELP